MGTKARELIAKLRAQRQHQSQRINTMQDRFGAMRDRFGTQMATSIPANQVQQLMQSFNQYAQQMQPQQYQPYYGQQQSPYQQQPQQQPAPQMQPQQPQSMDANYTQAFGGGSGVYYTPMQVQQQPLLGSTTPTTQPASPQIAQTQQPQVSPPTPQPTRPTQATPTLRPRPHANLLQPSKPQATLNPQRQLQQRVMRPKPVY